MKKNKNNFHLCSFAIMSIIYGCSGNTICINLAEKKIISKGGDIIRFEIEDNKSSYSFHLKNDIRSQTVVDLKNIGRNNNLMENYPGSGKFPFSLQPNNKYVFTNYTIGDASRYSVKFYSDSLGNLHSSDNQVCE